MSMKESHRTSSGSLTGSDAGVSAGLAHDVLIPMTDLSSNYIPAVPFSITLMHWSRTMAPGFPITCVMDSPEYGITFRALHFPSMLPLSLPMDHIIIPLH